MQQKYLLKKCTFELLLQTTLELLSVLENCTMVVANSWQQGQTIQTAPSYTVCAALHVYSIKDSDMKGIASTSKNTLSLPSIFVMRQTELLLNNNLLIQVSTLNQIYNSFIKDTFITLIHEYVSSNILKSNSLFIQLPVLQRIHFLYHLSS